MLDKKSKSLLKALYDVDFLTDSEVCKLTGHKNENTIDPITQHLTSYRFIEIHCTGVSDTGTVLTDGYEITIEGRAFIEEERRKFWYFFVPYAITTFIALLSLIGTIANHWSTIQSWFPE